MLSLAAVGGASAAPIVITFDAGDPIGGLAAGQVLSNQYAAFGVTFAPNAFSGSGGPTGSWATNTTMTVVSSTGGAGALGSPSLVSGNLLRSLGGWSGENGDPSFRVSFLTGGVSSFSATFAGIFTPSSVRLFAYNGATLLGTVTASGTNTGQQVLSFSSASPLTSVVVTPGDFFDWVGVDNITFEPTAAVPEPTTVILLGLGLVGAVRRRR